MSSSRSENGGRRCRILHVTDFHIADPQGTDELLREGYYQEYVDHLVREMKAATEYPVDCIIGTGDFVHKGNTDNFAHACTVLLRLASGLDLDKGQVAVCAGNHDIVQAFDKEHKEDDAREGFRGFAESFSNGANAGGRFDVCCPANGVHCVMLDSTLGANGESRAGDLKTEELDDIVRCIRGIPANDVAIIASHHHVVSYPDELGPFDDNDPHWAARHLWQGAFPLRERVLALRRTGPTIWLSGDIHKSSQLTIDGNFFVSTGRLGCTPGRGQSAITRQAKVLTLANSDSNPTIATFSFTHGNTHRQHQVFGSWKTESGALNVLSRVQENTEGAYGTDVQPTVFSRTGEVDGSPGNARGCSAESGHDVEVLDQAVQDEIIDEIAARGLYRLGRFHTGGDDVAISWVAMGPLMNRPKLLPSVVHAAAKWLRSKVQSLDNAVLLGMDCWGAVLASQLSVAIGARNYCIAGRGRGAHSTLGEAVTRDIAENVCRAGTAILVCDVVATGQSFTFFRDAIARLAGGDTGESITWYAVSVICDGRRHRPGTSFIVAHGTACAELRMPVVRADELPPEFVLNPNLVFDTSCG